MRVHARVLPASDASARMRMIIAQRPRPHAVHVTAQALERHATASASVVNPSGVRQTSFSVRCCSASVARLSALVARGIARTAEGTHARGTADSAHTTPLRAYCTIWQTTAPAARGKAPMLGAALRGSRRGPALDADDAGAPRHRRVWRPRARNSDWSASALAATTAALEALHRRPLPALRMATRGTLQLASVLAGMHSTGIWREGTSGGAALWGLLRTAVLEEPTLAFSGGDMDPNDVSGTYMTAMRDAYGTASSGGRIMVPRRVTEAFCDVFASVLLAARLS